MASNEDLGRAAYEAYQGEVEQISPMNGPWDGIADWNRRAWIAAGVAAVEASTPQAGSAVEQHTRAAADALGTDPDNIGGAKRDG